MLSALLCLRTADARADDAWADPFTGVRLLTRTEGSAHLYVLFVDLCAPGVSLRATGWEERGRTTSSFAELVGADAAVNGDYFNYGSYTTVGLAMHDGVQWPCGADNAATTPAGFGNWRASIHFQDDAGGLDYWMREVVGGQVMLVWDGTKRAGPGSGGAARTALGLSADRRTLILAVADASYGMATDALADYMISFGAHTAVNLDGGGSSTMWVRPWGVVNHPSGGGERTVANHLGVYARGAGHPSPHCPWFAPADQASGNDAVQLVNWPVAGGWPSDGHPEVFATSPAGDLLHAYPRGHGDDWCAPERLDGGAACGFAAGFWPIPANYPELFTPVSGGGTSHLWLESGAWNTLRDFGGAGAVTLGRLAASTWADDGSVEVFARGSDKGVWHNWWATGPRAWSGWLRLEGGSFASGPSVISWEDGHMELFALGTDGAAWHAWSSAAFPSGWHGWESMGGALASRPVPVRWPGPRVSVEVFARGRDGHLWHSWYEEGAWKPFVEESPSVAIAGEPSAAMSPAGAGTPAGPVVVARGADGKVLHLRWDGAAYRPFEPLGDQSAASDPFVWKRADGTLEVFVVDPAGRLRHAHRSAAGTWGAWGTIGEGVASCAAATPDADAATDAPSDADGGGEPRPEDDDDEDVPPADGAGPDDGGAPDAAADAPDGTGEDGAAAGNLEGGCACALAGAG